ncbi:DinB family protein [Streptomyces sp. M19]
MSASTDLLIDAFGRVRELVDEVVDGLGAEELTTRLDPEANSIAWLVWHLTRVQDDHVAGVAGSEQVWTSQGWEERFALPFPAEAIGYGQSAEEVARVRGLTPEQLSGYHTAVHDRTVEYVRGLDDADLAEVIDRSWTPPVTRGARLVSVIGDDMQHAGQAAFIRGVLRRR